MWSHPPGPSSRLNSRLYGSWAAVCTRSYASELIQYGSSAPCDRSIESASALARVYASQSARRAGSASMRLSAAERNRSIGRVHPAVGTIVNFISCVSGNSTSTYSGKRTTRGSVIAPVRWNSSMATANRFGAISVST